MKYLKRTSIFIVALILCSSLNTLLAQEQSGVKTRYFGIVDQTLPTLWECTQEGKTLDIIVSLQNGTPVFMLEGEISEAGVVKLYEYDERGRIMGIVEGHLTSTSGNLFWTDKESVRRLPIQLELDVQAYQRNAIIKYTSRHPVDGMEMTAFMRPLDKQVSFQTQKSLELRWMRYECSGSECLEYKPNQDLSNPVEFSIEVTETDHLLKVYPTGILRSSETLRQSNISHAGHTGYVSINFPILDNSTFDKWISGTIEDRITQYIKDINNDNDYAAGTRMSYFAQGDYFLTVLTPSLISGFLYFMTNDQMRIETIPFTFDREKNKVYHLKDIFKRDFDYAFFLNRYLEKSKKNLSLSEPRPLRSMVEKANYTHFVLSPSGLVFFTEFNIFFGRRKIIVPYTLIESFIDNASIESYFSKNLKK